MKSVRIFNRRWYDLGSDVDWPTYGGVWGRPLSRANERWAVIRLDTPDDERSPAAAIAVEVHLADVTPAELDACCVPRDGRDEFGNPVPPIEYAAMKAAAYINTWGANGLAGGQEFAYNSARQARARAARFLEEA